MPIGISTDKFRPIKNVNRKRELRKIHGLPEDKFIILHVGHINWGRNLNALIPLQRDGNQIVICASTSTPKDAPHNIPTVRCVSLSGSI